MRGVSKEDVNGESESIGMKRKCEGVEYGEGNGEISSREFGKGKGKNL